MTPYARSILKFLSVTYIIGLVGGVYALYTNLPVPHPVYWIVIGLLLVTSVTYSYYNAVGELRDPPDFIDLWASSSATRRTLSRSWA